MDAAEEAMDKEFHGTYDIWGGDIDPHAVEIARANAVKAEVEDVVRFEVADAMDFRAERPVWAARHQPALRRAPAGKAGGRARSTAQFGQVVRRMPPDWRVSILSSHTEFERLPGLEGRQEAQAL